MDTLSFNAVDIVALVILLFGVWRGFRRGLSGELARLISLAVVMIVGWQAYEPLGERLAEFTRLDPEQSRLAAFLCTVLAAGICMLALRLVLRQIMEFTFKKPLEKIGGMAAGFLRSSILIVLIVVAAVLTPIPYFQRVFAEESWVGSAVVLHVVPVYRQVAEENPQLRLPIPEGLERTERLSRDSTPLGGLRDPDDPARDSMEGWDGEDADRYPAIEE